MNIDINFWAILASMVASVIVGFIWYGPLFGKAWMKLTGMVMPDPCPPATAMIKPIIISAIAAGIMAYMFSYTLFFVRSTTGMGGVMPALESGFWTWLGFMVPLCVAPVVWEGKSWKLFFIHAGYWLVLLSIIATFVASF
jgi:hypothetical protein